MTRNRKPVFSFIVLFFVFPFLYGQEETNVKESIVAKFQKYTSDIPWEEVYVHTDREEYLSGEEMWLNVFLLNRQTGKLSAFSKIAYFEVLNSSNRPVTQKRILLEGGTGPGQITLPDTLSSGWYTVRAYTSWMKNFLPSNCFVKRIAVYNPLKISALYKCDEKIIPLPVNKITYSSEGFSYSIDYSDNEVVKINVVTDNNFRLLNNNICYLLIQTHGKIDIINDIVLAGNNSGISINKNNLSEGVNQIMFFDSRGKPIGERFIITPFRKNRYHSSALSDSARMREKVSLAIDINKEMGLTLNDANLSISVTPVANGKKPVSLDEYMLFGSEFGVIPDAIRNSVIDSHPIARIDSFLLCLKSYWIDWNRILDSTLPDIRFNMEIDNHYLSGRLISKEKKQLVNDKFVFLSKPGKKAVFQYSWTNIDGIFNFSIPINEEISDLILQPEIQDEDFMIKVESSFSEEYPGFQVSSDSTLNRIPDYIPKWSVNYQVRKIYDIKEVGDPVRVLPPSPASVRFYGKPDDELIMDDYIKLPVMSEVFFELLPGAFLKEKKPGWTMTISNPATNTIYKVPPVLFVDGVIINDASVIANIEPEIVEEIDVVRSKYVVGDALFYGLVNVITRAGDFNIVTLPSYATRLKYRPIDPVSSFILPDYSLPEAKLSRIPDFRNTLYWSPSVKPEQDGIVKLNFWASDYKTEYEINIQGITGDGKMVSLKHYFKIY